MGYAAATYGCEETVNALCRPPLVLPRWIRGLVIHLQCTLTPESTLKQT
jgi:hypothetical protein